MAIWYCMITGETIDDGIDYDFVEENWGEILRKLARM
jgi:hypothetical protein